MNAKIIFASLAILPCLAVAQSDFSLSTVAPKPKLGDAPVELSLLPPPLADVALRSQLDLARPKAPKVEEILRDVVNDLRNRKYDSALPKLEYLQGVRPGEADILILRGCIYAESGHASVAESLFLKAIQIAPMHPWARLNLAEAQVSQKKYPEAEKTLLFLASTRPESEVVRFKLVTVLAAQKKFPAAEQELQPLREDASTPAFYFASAATAFAQGDAARANSFIDQAHQLYSDSQTSYFAKILVTMGWLPESQ